MAPWGLPVVWALGLLSAVAPVAQAQTPPREVPSSRTGTASIRGRVVADDDTRAPIRNARVSLTSPAGTVPTVLADGEGRFAMTSLAAGRYTLSVAKPGYVRTVFGATKPGDHGRLIDVDDRAAVEGLEIRMPRSGAIAGRVVDDLGDPAAGVTVIAESVGRDPVSHGESRKPTAAGSAQTNDLGEYRIGGLLEGVFVVSVGGNGISDPLGSGVMVYVNAAGTQTIIRRGDGMPALGSSRTYYPNATALSDAQPISVSRGEERSAIDFVVAFSRQQSASERTADTARASTSADAGTLRGRILRADGRPLARARIRLAAVKGLSVRMTDSEDDGFYEFSRVIPDEYVVSASKGGFVDSTFGRASAADRPATVMVGPRDTREHIDLTLSPYGAIEGRLLDENGDPLEGARIRVLQLRFVAGRQRLADVVRIPPDVTDDRGRYRVAGVAPGQYFVSSLIGQIMVNVRMADVPGYAPTYFPGTENAGEARAVSVGLSQNVTGVDFVVKRTTTARIAGVAFRSNGDPIQGNLIMTASERSGALAPNAVGARIGPDGTFEFPNVAPGEYVIRASRDRVNSWTEGEFAALFVTVNGADVTGLLLRTSPGSTISGRITLEGAGSLPLRAVELAPVPVDPDWFGGQTARADVHDDWTFDVAGLNGPRRLRLARVPLGWALKGVYLNGIDVTDRPMLFGTAAQSISGLEVVLTDRLTEVSGVVADRNGRPIAESSVIGFSTDPDLWYQDSRFVRRAAPRSDGMFAISGLPPGEYFVAAVARRGFEEERQDPEFLDSIARQATRIVLAEGQKVAVIVKLATR
jgi:hypothetical protein